MIGWERNSANGINDYDEGPTTWVAEGLGYFDWEDYVRSFGAPEGRADMADRFVRKARQLGLDITVYYE